MSEPESGTAGKRPNILLLMTDQQRQGFTAGEGFGLDTMPCLDAVAARGSRLVNAYTTSPACVPARTSLLTGRFPSAHRVRQNSATRHVVRGDDLLDVLREAGYSLHFAGKPHVYRGPEDFDSYAGPYMHEKGPDGDPADAAFASWLRELDHGPGPRPTPFPLERQFPYRIVSDTIAAIDGRSDDRPFFCWASFPEPHNPYQAPEPYFSMFDPQSVPERACGPEAALAKGGAWAWLRGLVEEKRPGYDELWRRYRATYCGMLRMIDDQIARLLNHLAATGLDRDTIVVFLADHGDYVGDYGLQRKGAGVPEVLMRIPLVFSGPGIVARHNDTDLVSMADIFPTLCEAVGRPIPLGVQGRSLWPMLTGDAYPAEEFDSGYAEHGFGGLPYRPDERPDLHFPYEGTRYDELNSVTQSGTTRMLRHGRHKLVYDVLGRGELYDLASDPMELDNRWDDAGMAAVRADLTERLLKWTLRVSDELPQANYRVKRAPHNWHAPCRAAPGGQRPG